MKKTLLFVLVLTLFSSGLYAQGCVAIRSNGGVCTMDHAISDSMAKGWRFSSSYRYFKSFRHFKGDMEQKERLINHTEVINWQSTLDLTLIRQFNSRWSLTAGLPLVANKRSSLYEHGRTERHNSDARDIGDLRIIASRWMLNPVKATKGNFQLGLGMKLPTGGYNYKDNFYNVGPGGAQQERPVDQSIQPGDGGFGIISELSGYYNLADGFSAYTNLFYLANPRETNGTRTYRETLSPTLANEAITSVPDQYMIRLGANYEFAGKLRNLALAAGARMEGVPVEDLIGGSKGFRRPGYVISAEPGMTYRFHRMNFFATVPLAVKRNRLQSVTDKENSVIQNKFVNGDAAFADYSINLGLSFRL